MPRNVIQWTLLLLLAFVATLQHIQIALGVNTGITCLKFSGDSPDGLGTFVSQPGFSSSFRFDYRFNDAVAVSMQPSLSGFISKWLLDNPMFPAIIEKQHEIIK